MAKFASCNYLAISSCNYTPNCTQKHVITYTNSCGYLVHEGYVACYSCSGRVVDGGGGGGGGAEGDQGG